MAKDRYPYGVLNPVIHPQEGRLLDPDTTTGVGTLKKLATDANTPNFMDRITGPMKGVVLYVYEKKALSSEQDLVTKEEQKPKLVRCRVRIPEIHAHLPDPKVYGPSATGKDLSAISLHPIFVAQSEDLNAPDIGEIVWVDFKDRKRQEDPIYIGRLSNNFLKAGLSAAEGAIDSAGGYFKGAINGVANKLGVSPPFGDSVGQDGTKSSINQSPIPGAEERTESFQETRESSGLYDTYERGTKTGQKEMVVWINNDGKEVLVRTDVEHTLQFMKEDMERDLGTTMRINSGFRTFEEQERLYNRYLRKKREWENAGRPSGQKPSPAARPGRSIHNNGRATDFQTGVRRGQTRNKTKQQLIDEALTGTGFTAVWRWLIANSQRYGWIWKGGDFNPKEPWHFEFDENLARQNGLYPRE